VAEDAVEGRAADAKLPRCLQLVALIEIEDVSNMAEDDGVKIQAGHGGRRQSIGAGGPVNAEWGEGLGCCLGGNHDIRLVSASLRDKEVHRRRRRKVEPERCDSPVRKLQLEF
jgi:hypothetical protein